MERRDSADVINVGSGKEITIKALAEMIANKAGFKGKINWDSSKPDGMLKKCLDVSRISAYDFQPQVSLAEGIDQVIADYKKRSSMPDFAARAG
ncbi:MAG: NAD-dependent epimerase/dehydratase [uncultured bacterium]|nr:MAG: NAD-dependent epimerase/dehydratase [uncultured bacterium]